MHNHRIQRWLAPDYTIGTTVAGSSDGFPGSSADRLHFPSSVYVDTAGNLYVFDHGNNRLQRWEAGAAVGTTIHGASGVTGGSPFNADPLISSSGGTDYEFLSMNDAMQFPSGIFVGSSSMYVTDFNENRVQQRDLDGNIIRYIPADASEVGDGPGQLHYPGSVFVDTSDNLYVADYANHRVQKWVPSTEAFTTVAGDGTPGSSTNQLRFPFGIFVDKSGHVYVADTHNHRIMLWRAGAVDGEVVIGDGAGQQGDTDQKVYFPFGLYIDYFGKLYVVDSRNHRVQVWNLGHEPSVFQCSVGEVCILKFHTFGMHTGTHNRIRLVRSYKRCGDLMDTDESDGFSDLISTSISGLEADVGINNDISGLYVLGEASGYDADASFTVCWGISPTADEDYGYYAGTLFLIGPLAGQNQQCTAGVACVLGNFLGQGLTTSDVVSLLPADSTCAVDDKDPMLASNTYQSVSGGIVTLSDFELPIGGTWRLCYCTANFGGCDDASDFVSDAGLLTVVGPDDQHQDQTCIVGVACTLGPFTGEGLGNTDSISLVSQASSCGDGSNPDAGIAGGTALPVDLFLRVHLTNIHLPTGGQWSICYCVSVNGCLQAADYTVFAGILTVRGPSPLPQDRACTAGLGCTISSFTGQTLSNGDYLAMIDPSGTCSINDKDPTIMQDEYKIVDVITGATCTDPSNYDCGMEVTLIGIGDSNHAFDGDLPKGGTWSMCYCANYSGCQEFQAFTVQLGTLTVAGPTPLLQARTCVAGHTCAITGLLGQDLADDSRIMLLDTCGVQPTNLGFQSLASVANWPNFAISQPSTVGGTAFEFVPEIVAIGSTYRLCWCSGVFSCSSFEHFPVDTGIFTLVGPSPISLGPQPFSQDHTCVSGQTCVLSGLTGQELSDEDNYLLADTCSVDFADVRRLPENGFVVAVSSSGATLEWPNAYPTAQGGAYRLCWCAGAVDCSVRSSFRIDVGEFTLVGPQPLSQQRTCVSGQECSWVFRGEHLRSGDQILVMDTCGTDGNLPRWPNLGPSNDAVAQGTRYSWGTVVITAAGGEFRLCWCSNGRDASARAAGTRQQFVCSIGEQFRVDAGRLTLVGPGPAILADAAALASSFTQERTCVSGATCAIGGITGHYLADGDSLFVLETCGFHSVVPRFARGGIGMVGRGGASVWFGHTSTTSAGGIYQLCWCAAGFTCDAGGDYKVTAAQLHILGPSPLVQGYTCVSGQTCSLSGIVGKGLAEDDRFFVLGTCGQDNVRGDEPVVPRFTNAGFFTDVAGSGSVVSWGSVAVTAPGGEYRLCWCSTVHSSCQDAHEFKTDMGSLLFVGIHIAGNDRTCISGQTCVVSGMLGTALTALDQYMVLDTCGDPAIVSRLSQAGLYVSVASSLNATVTWGEAELTVAGGQYRLCWCSGSGPWCYESSDFRTDAGSLVMIGPSPLHQDQTCVSGQTCRLKDLQGVGLDNDDTLIVLDTCQQFHNSLTAFIIPRFPHSELQIAIEASGAVASWGDRVISAAGGRYRLCWCSAAAPCSVTDTSKVDIGTFSMVGLVPLEQDRTCVSGQTCILDGIVGQGLSGDDVIVLLDTCGMEGLLPRSSNLGIAQVISGSGASFGWPSIPMTHSGGQYRLCWCPGTHYDCSLARYARVDGGSLTLIGIGPLFQDRTCVSGQTCLLDGVLGQYLSSADRVLVADTCGQDHELMRFPSLSDLQVVVSGNMSSSGATMTWGMSAITSAGGEYRLLIIPQTVLTDSSFSLASLMPNVTKTSEKNNSLGKTRVKAILSNTSRNVLGS